jgi:hypothetical protein
MKQIKTWAIGAAAAAGLGAMAADSRAALIPDALSGVTATAFERGDNANPGDGSVSRVVDGNGLTVGNPSDPNSWTHSNAWQAGWQGNTGTASGWFIADLGSARSDLNDMYIWNVNEGGAIDRGVRNASIYYATNPTVAPPATPNSGTVPYDFSSGGWTLLTMQDIAQGTGANGQPPSAVIDLDPITQARYVGVQMNSNYGSAIRVGLAEVEFTVPEPSTFGLAAAAAGGLLIRRRRRR